MIFHCKGLARRLNRIRLLLSGCLFLFPLITHASFIESTMGAAVVNDSTATLYNPAALTLLKNPQVVALGTEAYLRTRFTGQSTQVATGLGESGTSTANSRYTLPSLYAGMPASKNVTLGIALISNFFNRSVEENSILRYVQPGNNIRDYDVIPAIGIKLNDQISIGAGLNFSYADFHLNPISGFYGLNIQDSQSNNVSDGHGLGWDVGALLKLSPVTLVGFNYRSAVTYHLSGQSVFEGSPLVTSNNYHFNIWTPARSVFSINHFVTPKLGFIGTLQRIQWSVFQTINVYGVATRVSGSPVIVNASIPYYLHNTWLLTLGSHYRLTPQWVLRVAGSYNQSPGNPSYQIANGNSFILGASMGYDINKIFTVDGSYAHAFIQNQSIAISGAQYLINGINKGSRDSVSLKLTLNV